MKDSSVEPYGNIDRMINELPIGYETYYERISPSIVGDRRNWHEFQHYKCSTSITNSGGLWYNTGDYVTDIYNSEHVYHRVTVSDPLWKIGGFSEDTGFLPTAGMTPLVINTAGEEFIPPPDGLNDLLDAALKRAGPNMKSNLSLVNSLYELKDLISIKHSVSKLLDLFRSKDLYYKLSSGPRTLRNILRTGSDSFLQEQFNIAPLVSDVYGVYTALMNVEQRVRSLINGMGRLRHFHYDVELKDIPDESLLYDSTWSGNAVEPSVAGVLRTHRNSTSPASKVHIQIDYNYTLLPYQIAHAQLLTFLDMLGVNVNPRIIWNAIPWTFVVDWVVNIGSWLSQFKLLNMEPQVNIWRCLWSVKRTRNIVTTRSIGINDIPWLSYQKHVPVAGTSETAYRRSLFSPSLVSLTTSGLSLKQISLGMALVFARGPVPKRWKAARGYLTFRKPTSVPSPRQHR
jgi:hypothetical protein